MAETRGAKLTQEQIDAVDDLVEAGHADNQSEALRTFINEGMRSYGYRAGTNGNTTLKWMSKELARLFAYAGIGWIAFFWAFPVSFRLPGVLVLVSALGMTGLYLLLERYEPRVSHAIFGVSEKA